MNKPTIFYDDTRQHSVKKNSPACVFVIDVPHPKVWRSSLIYTSPVLKRKGLSFETAEAFYEPMSKKEPTK